ncbi:multiple sugar transport system substrate-binding protein [Kribbella orskensis]|uniref:Multiple sugar transport system substrate-binding protein n=1 Tax=Kribbella orskensis TaxID=2512216 RepID=A0ABY2BHJ3_9ACTN|nr:MULTISPECIES: carbohydrate ABC transporter substrate-binding protein [Kribbella]TCN38285.1 multiple sugar transport system substrate-binding protein [Kribbella sp. VKM Ac-2500]TCO20185.1 multiple sugar transport system substrate-binding protein [Kribbella orskensis]
MTVELRGLTWDHPRGYRPLEAFEAAGGAPGVRVHWDRQPLSGFESTPLAKLAERYDLLIVDHPGLGAAIEAAAVLPVEDVFGARDLSRWRAASIPPTWESYRLHGFGWALPLDAAAQVCLLRPDLLRGAPPTTWSEVLQLADRAGIVLCVARPHAGLALLAMAGDRSHRTLLIRDRAARALDLLRAVWRRSDQRAAALDPIEIHELLAASNDLVCCPLVFSYAAYGRSTDGRQPLGWAPAPRLTGSDRHGGSTLGGTGLAVTPRAYDRVLSVTTYVRALLDLTTQAGIVSSVGGQSATAAVWQSAEVDADWNGHYSATRATVESAYVRPRFDGWIAFQDELSERVREFLRSDADPETTVAGLEADYRARVPDALEVG